ncbi:polysaccharide deacetylase family protein [Neobacillus cucumis]|uniref:polysaccharide deacetylase family protein n=1 Tax=Neobacillus cucumis TaxID=1740721 RepID=UPI0019654A64|nr:polysaccharide deacetylase family protein [Neobacillus cucumis]MBM7652511.1 peptidoglycan/xylan/chitin deacetylase (PgdA/CDA1 family) [Neobacillus cucumis]
MKIYSAILFSVVILTACNHSKDIGPSENHKSDQQAQEENKDNQGNTLKHDTEKEQPPLTVQKIVSLAKTGYVVNNPFAAHQSTISEVKKAWGEPNQIDQVGNGFYATYTAKHAVFGFTKDGRIYDVRSNEPSIQLFTFTDIKDSMGNPARLSTNQKEKIIMYKLNAQYQLKWIISNQTGKVDHISVYSPVELSNTDETYILSIKGNSKNLSPSAWQKMIQWRELILNFPKKYPNEVFVNGPDKKRVALTFDDGPDRINTPKIIDALKKENVKGTFFFIGQKVQQNPDIVKAAYDNGNVIGSHSFYHHELTKEKDADLRQDLLKSSEAIRAVIGKAPALLRPPYGDVDEKVISSAKEQQSKIIIWSIDTLDWSQKEQANIQKNVMDNVRNGDIILMHSDDDKTETAKAVPTIIEGLKARGFEIVDVATLLNTNPYR